MSTQLALTLSDPLPPSWADSVAQVVQSSISGRIAVTYCDEHRIQIATDGRWAATAVRAALLDAGLAIDGDPGNESASVTVWAIRHAAAPTTPLLDIADEAGDPERPGFLLKGPDGCVEQQCGAGGHNYLIAHASHPFPGSARIPCDRHGTCWQRFSWPLAERARHLLAGAYTATGTAVWRLTPEAEQRMRALYVTYIHATRP